MKAEDEAKLWMVVLGGMLASKKLRDELGAQLLPDDIPSHLAPLYLAMLDGGQSLVYEEFSKLFKIRVKGTLFASMVKALQEECLLRYCRTMAERAEIHVRASEPEELALLFEKMATKIRVRQAKMLDESEFEGKTTTAKSDTVSQNAS